MQAHLKTAQATARPKFLKELAKPTQEKIVFKKFPTLLKKIKTATHSRHAMTRQLNNDNGLQGRTTRTTGYNIAYEQAGLCSNSIIWIFNYLLYFYQAFDSLTPCQTHRQIPLASIARGIRNKIIKPSTS